MKEVLSNTKQDGWDLVREEKDDGVDVEITNYLVPQGEVLAFQRDGDWFYLHGDGLSSTQLVTDESGAQVGRAVYGAWGETLSSNETIPGLLETRFVGGLGVRNDAATGLIWMRHRWYDSELGRFVSRDPIGFEGDYNLYRYSEANPARFVDPTGLNPLYPTGVGPWEPADLRGDTRRLWNQTLEQGQRGDQWSRNSRPNPRGNQNLVRNSDRFRLRGGQRLNSPRGTMSARGLVRGGFLAAFAVGVYGTAANVLCQGAIDKLLDKGQELLSHPSNRSLSNSEFNELLKSTCEYQNMMTYCNAPAVFQGAVDFANSF